MEQSRRPLLYQRVHRGFALFCRRSAAHKLLLLPIAIQIKFVQFYYIGFQLLLLHHIKTHIQTQKHKLILKFNLF